MKTKIIFEDGDILVVEKPAGIAVESAAPGQMDAVSELKNALAGRTGTKNPYLGVVHRIDTPVEGLLLFAKNKKAADYYTKSLQNGTLKKEYLAVVFGEMPEKEKTLENYLVKEGAKARITDKSDEPGAKKAVLHYEVLKTGDGISLLKIKIETGRFHQIRAQLAYAGTPILGDRKYGNPASAAYSAAKNITQTALCAQTLLVPYKSGTKTFTVTPSNPAFDLF